jgi:hypothetical protein
MNISNDRRLKRAIEKYGENDPYVQMIRDQGAADARGNSAQDLYITGMVKRNLDQKPQGE